MEKFCIGVDVDKRTFKVCLTAQQIEKKKILGNRSFSNTTRGFNELNDWVEKKLNGKTASYVMEATGVYHEHLAYFLYEKGFQVHVVLPLRSKRYLQSLGIRSKTDKIDARGLAIMGHGQQLDIWQPASKKLLELRSLTRQIESLQTHKTSFKNQSEGINHAMVSHRSVVKSVEKMIRQLDIEIARLEKEVENVVVSDPVLHQKFELIKPLKGVGLMSFAVIVSETNGFELFKNQRQLVCYTGYDVQENQSGQKRGKTKISKKGNAHIRRILHLASWSVVRHKTRPFFELYDRVYGRTTIKMKGYVAVQRKLLVMLYTLWKKDQSFDPEFGTSGNQEPKILFSVGSLEPYGKVADPSESATLDRLPSNQSPEALFSVT